MCAEDFKALLVSFSVPVEDEEKYTQFNKAHLNKEVCLD